MSELPDGRFRRPRPKSVPTPGKSFGCWGGGAFWGRRAFIPKMQGWRVKPDGGGVLGVRNWGVEGREGPFFPFLLLGMGKAHPRGGGRLLLFFGRIPWGGIGWGPRVAPLEVPRRFLPLLLFLRMLFSRV